MRKVEKVIEMDKFTDKGRQRVTEAYEVISKLDKGLTKDEITILNNFLDEFLFEGVALLREKEYEVHGATQYLR